MNTILVASDFSDPAAHALRHALAMARTIDARLLIVHAVDAVGIPHPPLDLQSMLRDRLAELDAICAEAGVPVDSRYCSGHAWDVVAEEARNVEARFVVMGTRGCGDGAWSLGRTADRILRTAPVPVVAVPADAPTRPIRHVLAATDFSDCADAALARAHELMDRADGAKVTLLHAWRPLLDYELGPVGGIPTVIDDGGAAAAAQLDSMAAEWRQRGLDVATCLREGPPAGEVLHVAEEEGVDLIALGTHGLSGLAHLLLGSVAEQVVHKATVPVLTVGARTVEGAAPV